MSASALPVVTYLAMVLAAVVLPYLARPSLPPAADARDGAKLAILLAGGAIILTIVRQGLIIDGMILLILSAFGLGLRAVAGALAAVLLFAASTWWPVERDILPVQYVLAGGACLIVALFARQCRFEISGEAPAGRITGGEAIALGALATAGLAAGLLTGAANAVLPGEFLWHHWSAYVSPVNALLAGGVPFRDFPVQYGMGPTLLTAAACGEECWSGLYAVTISANALFLTVCGWSVLLLTRGMDRPARALALIAMGTSVLAWLGYPADWGGAIITPSAGGLRFLPLAMLTALILTAERTATARLSRRLLLAGHALWLLGLVWSPEAAFFTTLLWWPWLALRRADAAESRTAAWAALLRGGLMGAGAVIAGFAALALLFRAVFGDWVALDDFLLYLLFPPGRLPINAYGPVWYIAAVLLLGLTGLWQAPAGPARRKLYVCLLAALATTSYFVSRSFDNNLFNLLPALIVLLLAIQSARQTAFSAGFLRATLAAIIALPVAFHFHSLAALPGASHVAGLQLGPAPVIARLSPAPDQHGRLVAKDAAIALADLRSSGAGAVLLIDEKMVMPTANPAESWTGVNNAANFVPLPPEVIRRYVVAGARQFGRAGWMVVANKDAARWLGLFAAAYDPAEQRRYGAYTAYRMEPRNAR